ncbi:hypothetical protein BKA83DRAFT_1527961 [Pisolithus microcarpus]|nr:hypothetical protein BKA83DRAFT_1527961 [Pisolithus microcarpus]
MIPPCHRRSIAYFVYAWGNRERIDYGSGIMELNSLCWLICLERVGVLSESNHVALVIRAFWQMMRSGSILLAPMAYGASTTTTSCPSCWDLLNYEGTSISIRKRSMITRSSTNWQTTICTLLESSLSILTASLRWHSPMLDDISVVENMGQGQPAMIKRYKAQVPGRLFVMQHFLFGSILPCKGPPPPSETVHAGDEGRGDCCGYPSERFCSCEGKGGREEDRRAWDMTGPI